MKTVLLACIVAVTICWCALTQAATKKSGVPPKASVAVVAVPIEPPATISWSDGIVDVLGKLLSIDRIENVVLTSGDKGQGGNIALNAGDLVNSNELFDKVLHCYHPALDTSAKLKEALAKSKYYVDAKGEKVFYLENEGVRGMSISAPIVIAGIPFVLTVGMEFSYGQPIKHLDKTLAGRFGDSRYVLPFIVKQVHVQSLSSVPASKWKIILKTLHVKSATSWTLPGNRKVVQLKATDRMGASLHVESTLTGATLTFQSDRYSKEYEGDFSRYNEAVENEKLIKYLMEKFGPFHC